MEKNDPRTWSYEDALNNFEEFCNYFDAASASAAERTSRPTRPSGTAGDRITEVKKMQLYYRPPNAKEHLKLTDALNQMWEETFKEENLMNYIEGDSFLKSKGIKSPEDIG